MSDAQPARKEVSYEEIAAHWEKISKHKMRNWSITAAVCASLAIASLYSLASFNLPTYVFPPLIVVGLISVLVSLVSCAEFGRFSEVRNYEPKAWLAEGKHQKLKESFHAYRVHSVEQTAAHFRDHRDLIVFIISRSPELLAEFNAEKLKESPAAGDEKTEETAI